MDRDRKIFFWKKMWSLISRLSRVVGNPIFLFLYPCASVTLLSINAFPSRENFAAVVPLYFCPHFSANSVPPLALFSPVKSVFIRVHPWLKRFCLRLRRNPSR